MSALSIALWIAGAWILLRVLPIFMGFLALLRVTLRPTAYEKIDEAEVDPELARYLRTIAAPLAPLGFVEHGFYRVQRALVTSDRHTEVYELFHPESGTFASVWTGDTPDSWNFSASFFTEIEPPALTVNGSAHTLIGEYPDVAVSDPYAASIDEVARDHLVRLNGAKAIVLSDGERFARAEELDRRYLERLVEAGLAKRAREPDAIELTVRGAFSGAKKIFAARGQLQRMMLARRNLAAKEPGRFPEPPISEEVKAYRRHEDLRRSPNKRQTLGLIFGATAILFALSMLQLFDAMSLVVLIAVLFFHELGHFFAMRLFDYRDTTIFFIPFLGAAATGRKDRPSLSEEMIILLAGPMPGLLLGALLGFIPAIWSSDLGRTAVLMLVTVNLANLLPIFPLDGGRIVHALLFAGKPLFDAAFKLVAVVAFGGLGLFAGEGVLLLLALFVALTIPIGFRIARLEAEFRTEERIERPSDVIRWIFARLRRDKPAAFTQKLAVARQLEQRLSHESARWWRTIPWLGAYGCCIAGGVVVLAMGSLQGVMTGDGPPIPLACPIDSKAIAGSEAAQLSCLAPDEKTALELHEALVLAHEAAFYCVPPPWSDRPLSDEVRAAHRRALLTFRIAQHRLKSAKVPAEELQALERERAADPEFDTETIERFLRVISSGGSPEAFSALAERLGGEWKEECDQYVFFDRRTGNEVSFSITGDLEAAARHLCNLGCKVSYR